MSLVINHNLMAMNAARNLSTSYGKLSTSVQRMSSGLRINSAADDAAGLAIREMMRADIAVMQQGLRNAADAISLIQTADGALAVIDEKLIRMKELAEQAATGTYTTAQRDIINSEYQAMAREIDRIANSTNFNGVKLLDGSISNQHGGRGLKIHFGTGNNPAEDYYFINIGDARATSNTGLHIGGDAKNDIWGQGAAGAGDMGAGCCTAGFPSLNGDAGFTDGQSFSFGYNWDWLEEDDPDLLTGRYLAGRYTVKKGESLQDLIDKVNAGTQSRVGIRIDTTSGQAAALLREGGAIAVCVGDEAYVWGELARATGGSGIVSYYVYQSGFTLNGQPLFANSHDNTLLTANSALARALGFTSASIQAVLKDVANDPRAIEELNRLIGIMNEGSIFLSAQVGGLTEIKGFSLQNSAHLMDLALNLLSPYIETTAAKASEYTGLTAAGVFEYLRDMGANLTTSASRTVQAYVDARAWNRTLQDWTLTDIYMGKPGFDSYGYWSDTVDLNGLLEATEATHWSKSITVTRADLEKTAIGAANLATLYSSGTVFNQAMAQALTAKGLGQNVSDISATTLQLNFFGQVGTMPNGPSMWTSDAKIAAAIGLSQAVFSGGLKEILDLGDGTKPGNYSSVTLNETALTGAAMAKLTNEIIGFTPPKQNVGTGIYYATTSGLNSSGSIGFWTDDANVARFVPGLVEFTVRFGTLAQVAEAFYSISTKLTYKLDSEILKNSGRLGGGPLSEFNNVMDDNIHRFINNEEEYIPGYLDSNKNITLVGIGSPGDFNAWSLAKAINENKDSDYWAMLSSGNNQVYVFRKDGGDHNFVLACEATGTDVKSRELANYVDFQNVETGQYHEEGTNLTLGFNTPETWGTLKPVLTGAKQGHEVWNVTLNGRDVGKERDLWIAAAGELKLPGIDERIINGMDRYSFVEIQNADDGQWAGADIRTQSNAQAALDAINNSINIKDKIRADLGAMQNRLENTMTNLEIQAENLQAAESRISDVDVAKEMTEFTKNNILVQAAVGMLAQANSLSQLALSLMG